MPSSNRHIAERTGFAGQGFSRDKRLTRPGEFATALKQKALVRNSRFALHVLEPGSGNSDFQVDEQTKFGTWRLGLVVPKRFEASAVRRNAIKRIWREAFRRRQELLDLPARDLVARLLSRVSSSDLPMALLKQQCQDDAEILLQQMVLKLKTRSGFSGQS